MGMGNWELGIKWLMARLSTIIAPECGSIAFPLQGKVAFAKQMTEEVVTRIPNSPFPIPRVCF